MSHYHMLRHDLWFNSNMFFDKFNNTYRVAAKHKWPKFSGLHAFV